MEKLKNLLILVGIIIILSSLYGVTKHYYKRNKVARLYSCQDKPLTIRVSHTSQKKRIVLFGDSRIRDWGEPDWGKEIDVINIGIAGATTKEALCRLDDSILNLEPEWFIVQIGINDLVATSMMTKGLRLELEAKALYNIKAIVRKLKSAAKHVLVLTIVPPISPNIIRRIVWGNNINEAAKKLSEALIHKIPNDTKVYDMRKIFFDHQQNSWRENLSKDALHWKKEAYDVLNIEINNIINN